MDNKEEDLKRIYRETGWVFLQKQSKKE